VIDDSHTAAARFRAKKKQRNVVLQETAAELRERLAELQKEKEAVRLIALPFSPLLMRMC